MKNILWKSNFVNLEDSLADLLIRNILGATYKRHSTKPLLEAFPFNDARNGMLYTNHNYKTSINPKSSEIEISS